MAETPLPARLHTLDTTRKSRYRDNLRFYQGEQWPTRTILDRQRRVTFNYTDLLINKATSYTIHGVEYVAPEDLEPARRTAIQDALKRVSDDNDLPSLDFDTELDCAVLGDGAYRVTWDDELKKVIVSAPDVQDVYVWPHPRNPALHHRVVHQWDPMTSQPSPAGDINKDIRGVTPTTITEDWTDDIFMRWVGSELQFVGPNPYGFIPYVVFPNLRKPKEIWGRSDVDDIRAVQEELNRELTQISSIMELSGNPIAAIDGVDDNQGIAVKPGQVWHLPKGAKAELLDLLDGNAGSVHLEYLDKLYRALHDKAEVPRSAFGDIGGQLSSGIALRLELEPLLQKVERKRRLRTGVYQRRNEMILRLLSQFADEDLAPHRCDVVWAPVLPSDETEDVKNAVTLVDHQVISRRTAGDRLGVKDPDGELKRIQEETAQMGRVAPASPAPSTNGARGN